MALLAALIGSLGLGIGLRLSTVRQARENILSQYSTAADRELLATNYFGWAFFKAKVSRADLTTREEIEPIIVGYSEMAQYEIGEATAVEYHFDDLHFCGGVYTRAWYDRDGNLIFFEDMGAEISLAP